MQGFTFGDQHTDGTSQTGSVRRVPGSIARDIAEEAFSHTVSMEMGTAEDVLRDWKTHPRLTLEWGHLQLLKGMLNGAGDSFQTGITFYILAAENAEGIETIHQSGSPQDEISPLDVWAKTTSQQWCRTDTSSPVKSTPLRALSSSRCCCFDDTPKRRVSKCPHDDAAERILSETVNQKLSQDTLRDAIVNQSHFTLDGSKEAARVEDLSNSISTTFLSDCETTLTTKDKELTILSAEGRILAALLQLKSLEYKAAATNLRLAWAAIQPLRNLLLQQIKTGIDSGLAEYIEDDIKLIVGIVQCAAVEFPDGLRKALGSIASLAPKGGPEEGEAQYLLELFSSGSHRALHSGIAMVIRELSRPSKGTVSDEDQVLQALLLRHPNSTLFHIMCSLQRRRHGDPQGAFDALEAAKRSWLNPGVSWTAGRIANSKLPALLTMVAADTNFAALQYKEASRLYRQVIDQATITGMPFEFHGRAALRLAGAMTMMGLQKWPSEPWSNADEWTLKTVIAAQSNRQEEETIASVAARYAHHSYLRPLLPFWLLFLMGDLEALGPTQQVEIERLLLKLAHRNPAPPPVEDFLAFSEGRALHRLLLGAAIRDKDPEMAKQLWTTTLLDSNVPNTSIAIAYTQCLLAEEEIKIPHRRHLGIRMLVDGSQLAGDYSTELRLRFGAGLQSVPLEDLVGLLPQSWIIVLGSLDNQSEIETEHGTSQQSQNANIPIHRQPSGATASLWLGPVMKQRDAMKGMVSTMLGKLQDTSILKWKTPPETDCNPLEGATSVMAWSKSQSRRSSRRDSRRDSRISSRDSRRSSKDSRRSSKDSIRRETRRDSRRDSRISERRLSRSSRRNSTITTRRRSVSKQLKLPDHSTTTLLEAVQDALE